MAAVYLVGVSAKWWPTPDSALIMGVARSLAEGHGYTFNGQPHNVIPPGVPVILAALRRLMGPAQWIPNLFQALCGLAALCLIHAVLRRLADPRTALAATVCTAGSYIFYHNTHRVLTDGPFVALFWLVLYGCVRLGGRRWWPLAAGLLAASGVLVRFPGVVTLGVLGVSLILGGRWLGGLGRRLIAGAGVLAGTAGGVVAFDLLIRGTPRYLTRVPHALPSHPAGALSRLTTGLGRMPQLFAAIFSGQDGTAAAVLFGLPALVLSLVGLAVLWRRGERTLVFLAAGYPIALTLCAGESNLRARYLLPTQALLAWAAIEGLGILSKGAGRRLRTSRPGWLPSAAAGLTAVVVLANLPRVARDAFYYSTLSRTDRYYRVIRGGEYAELAEVARRLAEASGPGDRVAVRHNRSAVLHYLSRLTVVPFPRRHPRQTAADAEAILRLAVDARRVRFVVVEATEGSAVFLGRLRRGLEDARRFKRVLTGQRYWLYSRQAATSRPAGGARRPRP